MAQQQTFQAEISALKGKKKKKKTISISSKIVDLSSVKKLGPKSFYFMSSIIIKIHEKQLYTSAQRTLYELRTVYRVLKGWRDVRKVVGRCLDCRKINSKTDTVATVALPKVFRFSLQPKWIEIIFVKSKNQLCYFNNLCYNMLF